MSKPRLGFVGLGIMGRPMCKNLIQAGYELTVWNRSRPGIDEVVSYGAQEAASACEVAKNSDIIITMVADSPDVEEVILGPSGVLEGACPGTLVIDMTTMSPRITKEIAAQLEEKGVQMLDAPVSGGDKGAREGTLSIMVGGPDDAFERAAPIFEVLGKQATHIGPHGAGQSVKLCNQTICSLNILAMCEGLLLAEKSGVDMEKMLNAVQGGAAGSWFLTNLAPEVLKRNFEPGFMVRLQQKDLRLVMEAALELQVPLPGVALSHQLFRVAEANGLGDKGTQAMMLALEKMAGKPSDEES